MSVHEILHPPGWAPAIGYANGVAATPGRIVFIAGQVGWDAEQRFRSGDIVPQFEQALSNLLEVLAQAGGGPEHVCRITAFCCDRAAYLAARVEDGELEIPDCEMAAMQFMMLCQATLFQPYVFQVKPAPTRAEIKVVVDSATRLFLAGYRAGR